jgi:hypothetical protein
MLTLMLFDFSVVASAKHGEMATWTLSLRNQIEVSYKQLVSTEGAFIKIQTS